MAGEEDVRGQLAALPRRAVVAFAARCARRVQPLTHTLSEHSRGAIARAIAVAEAFANGDAGAAEDAAGAAGDAEDAAEDAAGDAEDAARDAASSDLDRLSALNLGRPNTLGAPIDPSEAGPLGPLWPDAAPDWYARATKLSDESNPPTARRDD